MAIGSGSKRTVSRYSKETEQVTHTFEVAGYSLKKGMGVGKFVRSATFVVGGYDWAIRFYPDGYTEHSRGSVSFYLELMTKNSEAMASYHLGLVNHGRHGCTLSWAEQNPRKFRSCDTSRFGPHDGASTSRSVLEKEGSGYIKDDCLTIRCALTVVKESQVHETAIIGGIKVPPSDLPEHFGKMLSEEEGADVTFVVREEKFGAHRIVLAARSPVFKAELYGQMKETMSREVTVEDIQPDVFRALLRFIYTDQLPSVEDLGDANYREMIRLLLVAAEKYAMERLKLLCQSKLGEFLDVETVATTLALADQNNCDELKDACIEFMASSSEMDAVVATEGYASLKRTCPSVLEDALEKTSRLRRI